MIVRELITVFGFEVEESKIRQAEQAVEGFKEELQETTQAANEGAQAHGGLLRTLAGYAALGLVGRAIWQTNVEFQRLGAAMHTVMGSARAADQAMDFVREFAATTPFQLQEVTQGFLGLTTAGFDATEGFMTQLGDIASGMSKSFQDIVDASRSAAFGMTRPLRQFGIFTETQGDRLQMTFQDITRNVERSAEGVQSFLQEVAQTEFAGGMARQMATMGGAMSLVRDNISKFLVAVGEGGLSGAIVELLTVIRDMIGEGEGLGEVIGRVLAVPIRLLAKALEFVNRHMVIFKTLLTALAIYGAARGLQILLTFLWDLGAALIGAAAGASALHAAMIALVVVILVIWDFIVWLQGGTSLIGAFVEEFENTAGTRGDIARWLRDIRGAVEGLVSWFENIGERITAVFDGITESVTGAIGAVTDFLTTGAVGGIVSGVGEVAEVAGGLVGGATELLGEVAGTAVESLAPTTYGSETEEEGLLRRIDRAARTGDTEEYREAEQELWELRAEREEDERRRAERAREAARLRGPGAQPTIIPNILSPIPSGAWEMMQRDIEREEGVVRMGETMSSINIDSINVTIEGTTGMGPAELEAATEAGVQRSLRGITRDMERAASTAVG